MIQNATPKLVRPDLRVKDIRQLDFDELAHNFQGIIFDKDNTLTIPHELTLYPPFEVMTANLRMHSHVARLPSRINLLFSLILLDQVQIKDSSKPLNSNGN